MRKIVSTIGAIVLLGLSASSVLATQSDEDGEHKVGICHRTASDSNPYTYNKVDVASLDAHLFNGTRPNGKGHPERYWKSDGTFRGVAHLEGDAKNDYTADDAADCDDFVVEVIPTPTPTPTPEASCVPVPGQLCIPFDDMSTPEATPVVTDVPDTAVATNEDARPLPLLLIGMGIILIVNALLMWFARDDR